MHVWSVIPSRRQTERESKITMAKSEGISYLSHDLIINLLRRLPPKTLCRFKCVSKQWRNLISHPDFIDMHRRQSKRTPLLLSLTSGKLYRNIDTGKTQYSSRLWSTDMEGRLLHDPEKFYLYADNVIDRMICCCDMICFMHWGQIYVCNPTSQQQLKLPDPPCVSFKSGAHVGFGYVPSKNVYKVVDFFSAEPKSGKGCMVFTLHDGGGNSGAWRVIADCPNIPTGSWCSRFACVNGTLYWRVLRQSYGGTRPNIAAFDLGEEKFRMIQYPQGHLDDYGGDMDYLIELEGFLCLVKSFRCKIMDVWMLKDQVWVKEYSIDFSSLGAISVLCHTPLDVRDGEILFKESQGDLLHYNIQSESFRRTTRLFCNGRFGSPFLYFDNLFSLGSS